VGGLPRILKKQRPRDAILMALGAGLLANSRPLEGALFCIPVAVLILAWLFSKRGGSFRTKGLRVVLPLTCTLTAVLLFMAYHIWRITKQPATDATFAVFSRIHQLPYFRVATGPGSTALFEPAV
jgi:hypothetical protein